MQVFPKKSKKAQDQTGVQWHVSPLFVVNFELHLNGVLKHLESIVNLKIIIFCQIDFSSKVVNDEKWRVGPGDSLTGQSGLSRLALLVKSVNLWGNLAEKCVQT